MRKNHTTIRLYMRIEFLFSISLNHLKIINASLTKLKNCQKQLLYNIKNLKYILNSWYRACDKNLVLETKFLGYLNPDKSISNSKARRGHFRLNQKHWSQLGFLLILLYIYIYIFACMLRNKYQFKMKSSSLKILIKNGKDGPWCYV